jgi:pimeloyl-ACP methyl ester carboxylesterase
MKNNRINSKIIVFLILGIFGYFGIAYCFQKEKLLQFLPPILLLTLENATGEPLREYKGKLPVLFVHGRGGSSEAFRIFEQHFIDNGYPANFIRAIDLYPNDGSNIEAAEQQIEPFVENFLSDVNNFLAEERNKEVKINKVDIVAHSMGSLSSRWYAVKVRPERVRRWISLAGPNHGNNLGCPGEENTGKAELCPAFAQTIEESFLQFSLNGSPKPDVDETPYGLGNDSIGVKRIFPTNSNQIVFFTIRTNYDEWISPVETVILDGCGGINFEGLENFPFKETSPGNFLHLNNVGHDQLLYDEATINFVIRILQTGYQ